MLPVFIWKYLFLEDKKIVIIQLLGNRKVDTLIMVFAIYREKTLTTWTLP